VGHQLLYGVDSSSPIYEELRGLIVKTVGMADTLRVAMKPLAGHIEVAFLFGSFAQGRHRAASDVDLLVVGNVTFANVAKVLGEAQRRLGREINPMVYSAPEFALKLHQGQHFLNVVMGGPKVFLIGDEDDLSRVAEARLAATAPGDSRRNRRPARRR
jgi:predicted nucleotidyltransferase